MTEQDRENNPNDKVEHDSDKQGSWLAIGISLGLTFGIIFDNLALGIALGAAFGLLIGSSQSKKSGSDS